MCPLGVCSWLSRSKVKKEIFEDPEVQTHLRKGYESYLLILELTSLGIDFRWEVLWDSELVNPWPWSSIKGF